MAACGVVMEVHQREDAAVDCIRITSDVEALIVVPLPDVVSIERRQRHVAASLALSVEKGVQEARAEPELLEVGVDSEKCDMGVVKLVTAQITEKTADEVGILCVDAKTGGTNPLLPCVLEVADACAIEALGEDFTCGLKVGDLERCELEALASEICGTHGGSERVGGAGASILPGFKDTGSSYRL